MENLQVIGKLKVNTKTSLANEEQQIFDLRDKILNKANKRGIVLRLIGGVAIRTHCPKYKYLHYKFGRRLLDTDFAGYLRQVVEIQKLFLDLGFEEDKTVMRLFGTQRRIFNLPSLGIHCDVVLDKLHFCHDIDLKERLKIDYPTIPLADLLLSKLQIVRIDEKDILDIIMILLEHPLGNSDNETINVEHFSDLCSYDWGLWRTIIINFEKTRSFVSKYLDNHTDERNVDQKIEEILEIIHQHKKSLKWRLRRIIGEKIKWYREVEELEQ